MEKTIRIFGLIAAIIFAVVGVTFLLIPEGVLTFFNTLSASLNMNPSPVNYPGFYLILTVAYMYLVTFLAIQIFKNPSNRIYLLLLANAKIASSILSLLLVFIDAAYLIYYANFVVDGFIGLLAIYLYSKVKA